MSKHTPEPWHESTLSSRIITDDFLNVIGETCPTMKGPPHDTMVANRARIVACVNACAGIEKPDEAIRNAITNMAAVCLYLKEIGHTGPCADLVASLNKLGGVEKLKGGI